MRADLLHVVEAAYDLEAGGRGWLQGLTNAIGPLVAARHGAYGATIDASDPARVKVGEIVSYRGNPVFLDAIRSTHTALTAQMVETMYRPAPVITTATEKVGAKAWNELARPRGPSDVADCAAVLAIGERSVGSMVIMPLDRVHRFSRPVKRVWARVVAHVVAMQRLRASLTIAAPRVRAEGVAVLSPSGKVEHATTAAHSASARTLLREAAIARESARGRLRRSDPDEAVEMWRALVDGRWSIVDRFDRDGRRFLIAHENEPQALEPRALTPRERQVVTFAAMGHSNKLIAYELGLATGAVGRCLAVAMKKLGLRARVDLARVVHEARSS